MRLLRRLLGAACVLALLSTSACGRTAPAPAASPAAQTAVAGPSAAPPAAAPAASRGASVPWTEYEAEDARTDGTLLAPSRAFGELAAESSGRRSVRLDQTGQRVQFIATAAANSLVVRYAIPDAAQGGGITATLSLLVDDQFRQALTLTSRYAWSYGGETETSNDPSQGGAHHFFDEARALVGDIPAGATVTLQKQSGDTAAFYVIDLIDLEQVAPPKPMPAGAVSIADCGATPDDATDDSHAIQQCVELARVRGQSVWIPPGVFESSAPLDDNQGIAVAGVAVYGAGMWHSTIHGHYARFHCISGGCQFFDFAIMGETTTRDDAVPENGFNGGGGRGSRLENVWVEHTKVGWWVGEGARNVTDGLIITGSRFRNLFADGVNLCNGASNSVVEHSHFRNTGDDALASWSPAADTRVNTNNVFRFNTAQLPWRANCFAIYGGKDNRIEDSLCADVVTYPGVLIAQDFGSHPFAGTTMVQRVSLLRAGGPMWGQEHGALTIQAAHGPVSGVAVADILIDSPTFSGIELRGPESIDATSFARVQIVGAGAAAITIADARGAASFAQVTVARPGGGGLSDGSAGGFMITRADGNSGW